MLTTVPVALRRATTFWEMLGNLGRTGSIEQPIPENDNTRRSQKHRAKKKREKFKLKLEQGKRARECVNAMPEEIVALLMTMSAEEASLLPGATRAKKEKWSSLDRLGMRKL